MKNWFIDGLLNIFGTKPIDELPRMSDSEAIRSDWEAIGMDLKYIINHNDKRRI